jgi:hypothetical protein
MQEIGVGVSEPFFGRAIPRRILKVLGGKEQMEMERSAATEDDCVAPVLLKPAQLTINDSEWTLAKIALAIATSCPS